MKIVVMGSGGLGGYYGALLAKTGKDVVFIARGSHLEAMQTRGLTVQSTPGAFDVKVKATDRPEEAGEADLVLFTVKTYDTVSACQLLKPVVGSSTSILTLQNGVDNKEIIESIMGLGRVIPGLAYIESVLLSPGVIHQIGGPRKLVFGEADGSMSERVLEIEALLHSSGVLCEVSDNVMGELWQKFLFICALAGTTCTTRLTLGEILNLQGTRWAFEEIVREALKVGAVHGVKLVDDAFEKVLSVAKAMSPSMKSSMLRDLEVGRRLEIDALNGTIVSLGRRHEVFVPVNEIIYALLKAQDTLAQNRIARSSA